MPSPTRSDDSSVDGEHSSAQYLEEVAASWSAHCGAAVTPSGTSEAHVLERTPVHAGLHTR